MRYFALLVAILALSCSKGGPGAENPEPTSDPPRPLPRVTIATTDSGRSVFEIMQFHVSVEDMSYSDNAPGGTFLLSKHYDSLVWSVPDRGMRFKLFEHGNSHSHYIFDFGSNFFSPGELDTRLSGYKDGEAVYEFEYAVAVRDDKDFLNYDWVDITENPHVGSAHSNVFAGESPAREYVSSVRHDEVPCVSLCIWTKGGRELPEEMERKLLFDVIGGIYGEPVYDEAGGEAAVRYGELFHHVEPNAEPLCVWLAARSKIALVRIGDDLSSPEFPVPPLHRYAVYAEEKNN